jgi:thiol-disulfide isomerase/thioredoxin
VIRTGRWSRSARVIVWAGTACMLAASCGGGDAASGPASVMVTDASGAVVTIDDITDGPLVANLWATWCPPCIAEMPAFDEVADDPDVAGVTIVGVNVGDSADAATAFADELGVTYPQFTDPDGLLSTALAVSALPLRRRWHTGQSSLRRLHRRRTTGRDPRRLRYLSPPPSRQRHP